MASAEKPTTMTGRHSTINDDCTSLSVFSDDSENSVMSAAAENPLPNQNALVRQEENEMEDLQLKPAKYTGKCASLQIYRESKALRPSVQTKKWAAILERTESI